MIRIVDWDKHFENAELKKRSTKWDWVKIPVNLSGSKYSKIVEMDNGPAVFGCWIALVELAAMCDPRGTINHSIISIARITGISDKHWNYSIPELEKHNWISTKSTDGREEIDEESTKNRPREDKIREELEKRITDLESKNKDLLAQLSEKRKRAAGVVTDESSDITKLKAYYESRLLHYKTKASNNWPAAMKAIANAIQPKGIYTLAECCEIIDLAMQGVEGKNGYGWDLKPAYTLIGIFSQRTFEAYARQKAFDVRTDSDD